MKVSFVIPTLDEQDWIGPQVGRCLALSPAPEVIVSDGGSADATAERARASGARFLRATRRGRAPQMNEGARAAAGDVFVFLHADVRLGPEAYGELREALQDPHVLGGAFRRRFDSPSRLLRLGCRLADLRGRRIGVFLGDQAIFVRKSAFFQLGGFREILLFEDVEFSRRMRRHGKTLLLSEEVIASSRRFDHEGNLGRLTKNVWLTALYLAGVHPDRLARRYYPDLCGQAYSSAAGREGR
ncbi:MAG TPA: TIGR04283 family arsenosugar biosynthesis glycosyltransferase [Candidatus Polarisedimenticolia bacterium]|jgi:rSAM/selenodomain-associated transferase 2|nr:TIGR04283 family arsenosugar biosynthesis glycosyltransferase [Candidatus Polarisedimenticolia bacterium]